MTRNDGLLLDEPLESELENAALRELLCAQIAAGGPCTFAQFMDTVLYHPQEGYYASARESVGRSGDYLTSPEISPLFGHALARQLAQLWRKLGAPGAFQIVEAGAGPGTLARDILRWIGAREPELFAALRYQIVERSAAMRRRQESLLGHWIDPGKVQIVADLEELPSESVQGAIIANELLDSFPVHRVAVENGRLHEVFVDCRDGRLHDCLGLPSTPALERYFQRLGLQPGEGCIAEVNLSAAEWVDQAARRLSRGYLFLLDYGYEAARLYAPWRRTGTLLCYHRHTTGEDPYVRLGRQDMTAHVDFTTLKWAAASAGLALAGETSQARLLMNLGISQALRYDAASRLPVEEYYARRHAVERLLDPSGLGRVRAPLFCKDAPAGDILGFSGEDETEQTRGSD